MDPLNYFSFQPVLHDWCNKGCGMCYPFIHLFIHSFIYLFMHSLIISFIICLFVCLFIYLLFIYSFIYSFVHSFIRSFVRSAGDDVPVHRECCNMNCYKHPTCTQAFSSTCPDMQVECASGKTKHPGKLTGRQTGEQIDRHTYIQN